MPLLPFCGPLIYVALPQVNTSVLCSLKRISFNRVDKHWRNTPKAVITRSVLTSSSIDVANNVSQPLLDKSNLMPRERWRPRPEMNLSYYLSLARYDHYTAKYLLGGAATCSEGFVMCFLKIPLACMGSMAAAVLPNGLGNFQKFVYKTFGTSGPPGIRLLLIVQYSCARL